MSIAVGQTLLWSDIKKLYTDAYDTGLTYNGHDNYLYRYGPHYLPTSSYPREDSSWGAGQTVIPEHVNRIIRAHNVRANNRVYKRAYNNSTAATIPEVSTGNLIKASDLSALRTYFNNALNYVPCQCNCDSGDGGDCCNGAECDMGNGGDCQCK